MFYPRQNSLLTLYFALGIMGVIGTADIGAFQFQIQHTAKSATASPQNEANHQIGEWKTPKKYIPAETSSFFLRKKFWVCDNRTTQLGEKEGRGASTDWGGSPLTVYFPLYPG